jgi:hypothetical protein
VPAAGRQHYSQPYRQRSTGYGNPTLPLNSGRLHNHALLSAVEHLLVTTNYQSFYVSRTDCIGVQYEQNVIALDCQMCPPETKNLPNAYGFMYWAHAVCE